MNNRIFKRIFSVLVSLSILLGVNNFCSATSADIEKVTANFNIKASNEGLNQGDKVHFDLYLNLVPDAGETFTSVNISGIELGIATSDNITFNNMSCKISSGNNSFDTSTDTFAWMNSSGHTFNTGADGDDGTHIATLTYTLNNTASDNVTITVLINEIDGIAPSAITDPTGAEAKLQTEAEISYTLQEAPEPETPACSHDIDSPTNTLVEVPGTDPNCTTDGNLAHYKCSICDKLFEDGKGVSEKNESEVKIAATGHSFGEYKSNGNATCTADGTKTAKCDNCDARDTAVDTGSAGHSFTNYKSNNNATCIADGTKTAKCDRCDAEDTVVDEGSALGHSFTYYVSNNDATCTEDGTKTAKCNFCDETDEVVDEGSALGHDYVTTVVAATSTTLGGTSHTCSRCGDEYWTDFTKDDKYAQVNMPNGETVYHYCTHNGLATETTVDLGDGTTLRVFLQDPLRVLKKNDDDVLGVFVSFVPEGSSRYKELMASHDKDHAAEHLKLFEVYPTVNGRPVTGALDGSVYMEYEIPEGWDESDLEMILVRDGEDQEFEETVLEIDGKRYLAMWKNHFSPYAMIDKLSAEEKAEFNKLPKEEQEQLLEAWEKIAQAEEAQKNEEKSSSNNVKTGDESGYVALLALSTLITTGLYLELFMKKKRNV